MRTIGILQPNFIPWRGYFDFIHEVDVFVFLDDVQYSVRDWRNRNRVRTRDGRTIWLTVPVLGGRDQLIKEARIDHSQRWKHAHLETFRHNYGKAPYFQAFFPMLERLYSEPIDLLSDLNVTFTEAICAWLGTTGDFRLASELATTGSKDEKLLQITKILQGDRYLSGPSARAYLKPEIWEAAGIQLDFKVYDGYPTYAQISEPFDPQVSILDLLFMTGPSAPDHIWGHLRNS